MNPPHIVRVLASVRLPSSHGRDVDYEILQAVVSSGADHAVTHESVLLRLVVGNTPQDNRVAEVLIQDLPAVQAQWSRFVQDLLWRRAQAGDKEAQAALEKMQAAAAPQAPPVYFAPTGSPTPQAMPAISASGGRFGQTPVETPYIPVKKEKKTPPDAPIVSSGPRKYFGKIIDDTPAEEVEEHKRSPVPARHQVIAFNFSMPPTADALMRPITGAPDQLIVVAPMAIAPKVEEFIQSLKAGRVRGKPTTFNPIVIRRDQGPVAAKKLRADIAGGIARMLGDPNSALWITPE